MFGGLIGTALIYTAQACSELESILLLQAVSIIVAAIPVNAVQYSYSDDPLLSKNTVALDTPIYIQKVFVMAFGAH